MTMLPIMTPQEAAALTAVPTSDPDFPESTEPAATRRGGVPAFRSALRQGLFPVVPDSIANATEALTNISEIELAGGASGPFEGLSDYCHRVAADVLAGKDYPPDFADGAYAAVQAAERAAAAATAARTIRGRMTDKFPHVIARALPELLGGLRTQILATMKALRRVDTVLGDLDLDDPAVLAAATDEQRAAFLEFRQLHATYKRARYAQRSALQASGRPSPNWTQWSPDNDDGWPQVFEAGVHECADIRQYGSLTGRIGSVPRFRGLAQRPDVWVPTVQELELAWDQLNDPRPRPVDDSSATTTTTTGSAA